MAGLKFQAERAAFGLAADKVLKYMNKTDDRTKALLKLVDLTENFAKDRFQPGSYEAARKMIQDPDNKWVQYLNRLFDEVDPHVLKTTALNLGFDAMPAENAKHTQEELVKALVARETMALQEADVA